MKPRVLITGSSGLVGSTLKLALEAKGFEVICLDLQATGTAYGDTRDIERVRSAVENCDGIVHMAAVSRVVWGEQAPELCWETNVDGLRNIIEVAHCQKRKPWIIFGSSREVYGQPASLPVSEDVPLQPMNIYGRSKVAGEQIISDARAAGFQATTVRLSNVYGSIYDHVDRVIPAFARGAVMGQRLRVDGARNTFDFTHINDTIRGLVMLVNYLMSRTDAPPPIHFLTGYATTLQQLAEMAIDIAESDSEIQYAPARTYDVANFYGNPGRAHDPLDWVPQITLQEGLLRLINDFRKQLNSDGECALL